MFVVDVARFRAARTEVDHVGGGDSLGTKSIAGCHDGQESMESGILAVPELQGGFVTECEVDGNDP